MAIGIEFLLKANTAAFTRGLATIDNATGKLQKSLMNKFEGRDLARGLTTALGLSVDKIADKIARMWTGMTKGAEEAYAQLGNLTDTLTEKTIAAGTAKLNDEDKYQLALLQSERLKKRIADNEGKTVEQQLQLTKDKIALLEKEGQVAEMNAKRKAAYEKQFSDTFSKWDKEKADREAAAEKKNKDARDELEKAQESDRQYKQSIQDKDRQYKQSIQDKFAPSVDQLAGMDVGTGVGQNDLRLVARRIKEKEAFAAAAAGRGDIAGALRLGGEATAMRESISNMTGDGALTAATAKTAFTDALTQTNQVLTEIRDGQSGMIKATP